MDHKYADKIGKIAVERQVEVISPEKSIRSQYEVLIAYMIDSLGQLLLSLSIGERPRIAEKLFFFILSNLFQGQGQQQQHWCNG